MYRKFVAESYNTLRGVFVFLDQTISSGLVYQPKPTAYSN